MTLGESQSRPDLVVPGFLLAVSVGLVEASPQVDSRVSGLGDYFLFAGLLLGATALTLFVVQILIPRLRPMFRSLRRIVGFLSTVVLISLVVSITCTAVVTRQPSTESPRPSATPAGTLLKNGDFTQGLDSWTAKTAPGIFVGYAKADIRKFGGKSFATLEVPGYSEAYLEQELTLPSGPSYELNVTILKERAVVVAYVALLGKDGNVAELERFTPVCDIQRLCSPELKRYDLSSRAGQTIKVRIGATSPAPFGAALYIDSVRVIPSR